LPYVSLSQSEKTVTASKDFTGRFSRTAGFFIGMSPAIISSSQNLLLKEPRKED
jgi:hypothetical protein